MDVKTSILVLKCKLTKDEAIDRLHVVAHDKFADIIKAYNPNMDMLRVGSWVSIIIITITIFLTASGVFDRIAKFGGAGTFIPISGFANSIASCAIEFKNEGLVFAIGAKMFYVAGPVIVNGVAYSIVVGLVYSLILLF